VGVRERLERVVEKMRRAAVRAGRGEEPLRLVAVTKGVDASRIVEAAALGVRDFGENYAQEFMEKRARLEEAGMTDIRWHFVGRLQRNKVKYLVGRVKLIHSLDSVAVAREIEKRAARAGVEVPVLVEVNLGGEHSKGGVAAGDVQRFVEEVSLLEHVHVVGLMTIPPPTVDPERSRPYFVRLRELRDELSRRFPSVRELSMGMSDDYEVAIEEGATYVRIGRAIFGRRA